jgi:hypothetical protein
MKKKSSFYRFGLYSFIVTLGSAYNEKSWKEAKKRRDTEGR